MNRKFIVLIFAILLMNLQLISSSSVPVIVPSSDDGLIIVSPNEISTDFYTGLNPSTWAYEVPPVPDLAPSVFDIMGSDATQDKKMESEDSKFYYYSKEVGDKKIYFIFDKDTDNFIGDLEVSKEKSQEVDIALQYQSKSGLPIDSDLISSQIMPKGSTWQDVEGNIIKVNKNGVVIENGIAVNTNMFESLEIALKSKLPEKTSETIVAELANEMDKTTISREEFERDFKNLLAENGLTPEQIKDTQDYINEEGKYLPWYAKAINSVMEKLPIDEVQASEKTYDANLNKLAILKQTWDPNAPVESIDVDVRKTIGPFVFHIYTNGLGNLDELEPIINEMAKSGIEVHVFRTATLGDIEKNVGDADAFIVAAHGGGGLLLEKSSLFSKLNPFSKGDWLEKSSVEKMEMSSPKFAMFLGCNAVSGGEYEAKYGSVVDAFGEKGLKSAIGIKGFIREPALKDVLKEKILPEINKQFKETGIIKPKELQKVTSISTYGETGDRFNPQKPRDVEDKRLMDLIIPKNIK